MIRRILELRNENKAVSSKEIARRVGRSQRTAARHLKRLRETEGCDLRSHTVWIDQFSHERRYWIYTEENRRVKCPDDSCEAKWKGELRFTHPGPGSYSLSEPPRLCPWCHTEVVDDEDEQ